MLGYGFLVPMEDVYGPYLLMLGNRFFGSNERCICPILVSGTCLQPLMEPFGRCSFKGGPLRIDIFM